MFLFVLSSISAPCLAKLIARRDPLDGALDATVIVIMARHSQDTFRVEESFLGRVGPGDLLTLPGFQLTVEDLSSLVFGVERIEPIQAETRILVFLKPAKDDPRHWKIAGFGNCYFWSHDPLKLDSLRAMAVSALDLRRSWESARNLPDARQRVEALWPYLWDHNRSCYAATEAALLEQGPVAGDSMADRLGTMTQEQKMSLVPRFAGYHSDRLHTALIEELKAEKAAWERLLSRRGGFATINDVITVDHVHYSPRRPQDSEADEAEDILGLLYYGFAGLATFRDRADLPLIRESALWGVKYRFKQLDDAALGAFRQMPEQANLSVIEAIWQEYSNRPNRGNELQAVDVIRTLNAHRFPAAIPLMAQFANAGFAQQEAQQFLREMTGADFGDSTTGWLGWYENHRQ